MVKLPLISLRVLKCYRYLHTNKDSSTLTSNFHNVGNGTEVAGKEQRTQMQNN